MASTSYDEVHILDTTYPESPRCLEGFLSGCLADRSSDGDALVLGTIRDSAHNLGLGGWLLTENDYRCIARRLLALPIEARIDATSRATSGITNWAVVLQEAEDLERQRSDGPSRDTMSGDDIQELATILLSLPHAWRVWVVEQRDQLEAAAYADEHAWWDRL